MTTVQIKSPSTMVNNSQ